MNYHIAMQHHHPLDGQEGREYVPPEIVDKFRDLELDLKSIKKAEDILNFRGNGSPGSAPGSADLEIQSKTSEGEQRRLLAERKAAALTIGFLEKHLANGTLDPYLSGLGLVEQIRSYHAELDKRLSS